MRGVNILVVLGLLLLTACSGDGSGVSSADLEMKKGLYYLKGSKFAFSGTVVDYFPTKNRREKRRIYRTGRISGGRKDGDWVTYAWGGGALTEPYDRGRLNGNVERTHDNGQLIQRTTYVNNRRHGPDIRWDWKGDRISHNHYRNGSQVRPPRKGKKTTKSSDNTGGMSVR